MDIFMCVYIYTSFNTDPYFFFPTREISDTAWHTRGLFHCISQRKNVYRYLGAKDVVTVGAANVVVVICIYTSFVTCFNTN